MNSWKNYLEHNAKVIFGTFADPNDGMEYKTVTIGNQTWMADNYKRDVTGSFTVLDPVVGRLYTATATKSLAPEGWHIPTQTEWNELVKVIQENQGVEIAESLNPPFLRDYVDDKDKDFKPNELFVVRCVMNASKSSIGDNTLDSLERQLEDAKNETKLQKKRADDKETELVKCKANFYVELKTKNLELASKLKEKDNSIQNLTKKLEFYKQRCEELEEQLNELGKQPKNNTLPPTQEIKILPPPKVFRDDRDGEDYRTVNINGKIWFAQNLRYKGNLSESESCSPDNNSEYDMAFGRLYTLDAALRACPRDWHLPTQEEWQDLHKYMTEKYGSNYRNEIAAPVLWGEGQGNADFDGDKEGLSLFPAGCAKIVMNRLEISPDFKFGFVTRFWTAPNPSSNPSSYSLDYNQKHFSSIGTTSDWALSVRCVKDADKGDSK